MLKVYSIAIFCLVVVKKNATQLQNQYFSLHTPESFAWKNGSYVALMSLVEMFAPVQNKPFAEERDQNVFWAEGIQLVSLPFSCFQFSHLSPSTTTITWDDRYNTLVKVLLCFSLVLAKGVWVAWQLITIANAFELPRSFPLMLVNKSKPCQHT